MIFGNVNSQQPVEIMSLKLSEDATFLNSPHTSVRGKRIGREKYTRQSNVR